MSDITARRIAALSAWIDGSPENQARDPEAATWGRLAKVAEECGEVISAYIGVTGQNPRKGTVGTMEDVRKELLDVALTALCAVEHLDRNVGVCGVSMAALEQHVSDVYRRAQAGPCNDPILHRSLMGCNHVI